MTGQEAFLVQAKSDFHVFEILLERDRSDVAACHPLHYLQMSTEKLAKAAILAQGESLEKLSHVAFSLLPYVLRRNDVGRRLGWRNPNSYRQFLTKAAPIFREIDELNPSLAESVISSSPGPSQTSSTHSVMKNS